jgi:hypothetical protein
MSALCERIAVLSTPRAGNTWLRRMMAQLFHLHEIAVHSPADLDWTGLPARSMLQLHWYPEPELLARLYEHRFKCVSISRHPIDVLISILHFARYEPETARWLVGQGGSEAPILQASPESRHFLDYATGERAGVLLKITMAWWRRTDVIRVRYEDMVTRTVPCLLNIAEIFNHAADRARIATSVASHTLERAKLTSRNQHFWKGTPGLWRELLTAPSAKLILDAHLPVFEALAYDVCPAPDLDVSSARRNWAAIL